MENGEEAIVEDNDDDDEEEDEEEEEEEEEEDDDDDDQGEAGNGLSPPRLLPMPRCLSSQPIPPNMDEEGLWWECCGVNWARERT